MKMSRTIGYVCLIGAVGCYQPGDTVGSEDTVGSDKMKDELAVVSECFDLGAYTLGIDPQEYTSLFDFLKATQQRIDAANNEQHAAVLAQVDLSGDRVVVNDAEFTWEFVGQEHDSYFDGSTAFFFHYKISGTSTEESLSKRIELRFR